MTQFQHGCDQAKMRLSAGPHSPQRLERKTRSLHFQLLEAAYIPWLIWFSSIFTVNSTESANLRLSPSAAFITSATLTRLLPLIRILVITLGSPWQSRIISPSQNLSLIILANAFVSCKGTYSLVQQWGCGRVVAVTLSTKLPCQIIEKIEIVHITIIAEV